MDRVRRPALTARRRAAQHQPLDALGPGDGEALGRVVRDEEGAVFSDGDTGGPWSVKVVDAGGQGGTFAYSLDRNSGVNGDTLHLTIQALRATQRQSGVFYVISKLGSHTHYWIGLIGQ